jgi:hypothetical protein
MIIKNGFIINPDQYLRPQYRISPFLNQDLFSIQETESDESFWDEYMNKRWGKGKCYLTSNGREALSISLKLLNVNSETLVTILTPSENKYISSCVTREIEKLCKWNRKIESNTAIILVIHEFGKTYPNMENLKSIGIPIIEDCAYAFLNSNHNIGEIGDYCIYSLPKIFPIQIGGLITSAKKFNTDTSVDDEMTKFIKTKLNKLVKTTEEIIEKRNLNFFYLENKLKAIGIKTRFDFEKGEIPGVFMFATPEGTDLPDLKSYMYSNGIECSVFYGENAFFIPCHQNLTFNDLDYFTTIISTYFNHA